MQPILSQHEKERTREVKTIGETKHVRKIPPSKEAINSLGPRTKREVTGHMAINPPEIEKQIRMQKATILREMAMMSAIEREEFIAKGPIDFVKDKGNRKRYDITCTNCQDQVAYVWADNEQLDNWCDLHYLCWYNKTSWRGAMAINVSPIDGKIGIECACGEDTRDFRTNRNMPPIQKKLMIEYSQKHRDFATKDSRFIALESKGSKR